MMVKVVDQFVITTNISFYLLSEGMRLFKRTHNNYTNIIHTQHLQCLPEHEQMTSHFWKKKEVIITPPFKSIVPLHIHVNNLCIMCFP